MKYLTYLLLAVMCVVVFNAQAHELKVGYIDLPPFTNVGNKAKPGLTVEIWQQIAAKNHWQYRLLDQGSNVDTALKKLNQGKLDVLIGGISVNQQRINEYSFSRPYFIGRIGLLTKVQHPSIFHIAIKLLRQLLSLKLAGVLIVVLLLIYWLYRMLRADSEQVEKPLRKGYFTAAYFTFVALISSNLEYDSNKSATKLVSFILIIGSLILSSIVIALLTSAMTVALSSTRQIIKPEQIGSEQVVVLKGSSNIKVLEGWGVRYREVGTVKDALQLLKDNQVLGFVSNISSAKVIVKKYEDNALQIDPVVFRYDELAFAFPKRSPLLDKFNHSLVELQDTQSLSTICEYYLGETDAELCSL